MPESAHLTRLVGSLVPPLGQIRLPRTLHALEVAVFLSSSNGSAHSKVGTEILLQCPDISELDPGHPRADLAVLIGTIEFHLLVYPLYGCFQATSEASSSRFGIELIKLG